MENSKFLIRVFILMLFLTGCKMKPETKTEVATKQTIIQQLDSDVNCASSTNFIIRLIDSIFIKYKLEYETVEEHTDNICEYGYRIISLNNAELHLLEEVFVTEDEAMKKIREIKEEKEREPMIKIFNFIFRKENIVYSINSTENISHIRAEIYDYLLKYYNVNQIDKILY